MDRRFSKFNLPVAAFKKSKCKPAFSGQLGELKKKNLISLRKGSLNSKFESNLTTITDGRGLYGLCTSWRSHRTKSRSLPFKLNSTNRMTITAFSRSQNVRLFLFGHYLIIIDW